jgi:SAM-dependent methyltransferase
VVAWIKNSRPYIGFRSYGKVVKRYARLPRYLGTEFRCPICGVGLREFKPMWKSYIRDVERFGYIYRDREMETGNGNAMLCPKCDAMDRERLMAIYLDRVLPAPGAAPPKRLIDFAPSYALRKKLNRMPQIAYRSADLSRADVQDHIDLTDIRYPDESVDVFICSHVLEHIPEDRKAMRELRRILKHDGFGLVLVPLIVGIDETHEETTPMPEEYRWKYFGLSDHVRQYGKRDFVQRLTEAGLAVEQLGIEYFGAETFRLHGISPTSVLYVARRGPEQKAGA